MPLRVVSGVDDVLEVVKEPFCACDVVVDRPVDSAGLP
jgi:hypothetical protein